MAGKRVFPPKPHAQTMDAVIGAKGRALRNRIGISQALLGAAIGVTFQQIQKYETGANRITATRLFAVAESLGVDIGHFFERLHDSVPTLTSRPKNKSDALSLSEKEPRFRPDPEAQDLLALFYEIGSAKYRRQLLELARSFVEATSTSRNNNTGT